MTPAPDSPAVSCTLSSDPALTCSERGCVEPGRLRLRRLVVLVRDQAEHPGAQPSVLHVLRVSITEHEVAAIFVGGAVDFTVWGARGQPVTVSVVWIAVVPVF